MESHESWSEWSETPRDSESYNEIAAHLESLRGLAKGAVAESMATHGDEPFLKNLERLHTNELGKVEYRALPGDPHYSPDKQPRTLSESELSAFVDSLGASIARNIHGTRE